MTCLSAPPISPSPKPCSTACAGEAIAVTGPAAITGRIVSVTREPAATQGREAASNPFTLPAMQTRVTLLTPEGFRQFVLEQAASVRLTDDVLRARVGAALDASRQQAQSSSRHLTLRTAGTGPDARTVTVGYVAAAPLWKASYRLVLPEGGAGTARVQGWAVLEDQSGNDWKAVDLTLQAGNPVTFRQAIYSVYFADRPEVPVDVVSRILPDTDERASAMSDQLVAKQRSLSPTVPEMAPAPAPPQSDMPRRSRQASIPAPYAVRTAMSAGTSAAMSAPAGMAVPETAPTADETPLDTVFHIVTPVDLARGHTASVPILDRSMPAEPLDWLQATATRPVSAVRLTNDGAASLPAGALTLYTDPAPGSASSGGAAFAGDARLGGLPAGESRLLAFAEDLRTTATRDITPEPDLLQHVTVAHGIMHRTLRHRTTTKITLTAPVRDPRRVLVDFAKRPDATFTFAEGADPAATGTTPTAPGPTAPAAPDPAHAASGAPAPAGAAPGPTAPAQAETATAWRVTVNLKPGETRHLTAYADTTETTEDTLLPDDGTLNSLVLLSVTGDHGIDPALRQKLQPLYALRDTIFTRQAALDTLLGEQSAASTDEDRIRNNLGVVHGPGDLHEKLLAALDADETKLATLKTKIEDAQNDVAAGHKALADAVAGLQL